MTDKLKEYTSIGLGGGCHWCTEAVYASLIGIKSVKQGWVSAKKPDDEFSEAVLIEFNEAEISLETIIDIHLQTHSATSNHSMRKKYRSAVYVMNEDDHNRVKGILVSLQESFKKPLITRCLRFKKFKSSGEQYINYYEKNPDKPFCQVFIQHKLNMLLKQYTAVVDNTKISES